MEFSDKLLHPSVGLLNQVSDYLRREWVLFAVFIPVERIENAGF